MLQKLAVLRQLRYRLLGVAGKLLVRGLILHAHMFQSDPRFRQFVLRRLPFLLMRRRT